MSIETCSKHGERSLTRVCRHLREVIGEGRHSRPLLCAALLSLAACGGDEPVFTKLFTTEHFVFYAQEGAPAPCDSADQWLERYYGANARFLGAGLPPGERIEYYLVQDRETLAKIGCSDMAGAGCTEGTTIRAQSAVVPHEVVHANANLLGNPPILFQEGLAVVLSCRTTGDDLGPLDTSAPVEQLVETNAFLGWSEAHGTAPYDASATFVRYLLDRFGAARFLSFYARAPLWGSREEVGAVFRAEMGVGLDEAFSALREQPATYFGDSCLRLMECDPSMPALADGEQTLRCGPLGSADAVLRFAVPEDRVVHFTMEPVQAEPQTIPTVGFYRCTGGDAIGTSEFTAGFQVGTDGRLHIDPAQPASAFALDVPPGEYVAWLSALAEARVHLGVEERRSPMRDTPCQAAVEPLALDDAHLTTLTSRWVEHPCDGPWCPGQGWDVSIGATGGALEAQALGGQHQANFSPSELYLCPQPCPQDPSTCEVLALDTVEGRRVRSKQTFAPGAVVHVGAPAAPYAGYFAVRLRVAPE